MIEDAISYWTEIQRFENMLAADPRSYCFVPLSELYRKLGLLDDAVSVAAKGCGVHPDYPGGFFALGAAYNAKGQKAEARAALERAVALKPDHVEALKLLGQLYVEDGQMELAAQALRQVLRENPDDTETDLLLKSIAPQAAAQPEEEIIEDVEILDDLELVEEPAESAGRAPQAAAPQSTIAFSDEWGFEPEEEDIVEEADASADFWAIGSPQETAGPAASHPAEEGASFRDFEEIEDLVASPQPPAAAEPAAPQRGKDPLTTATMAELYLSQGFFDRALSIYRELSLAEPANPSYRAKVAELQGLKDQAPSATVQQAPAAAGKAPPEREAALPQAEAWGMQPAPGDWTPGEEWGDLQEEPAAQLEAQAAPGVVNVESELNRWLENIRRRRDGV